LLVTVLSRCLQFNLKRLDEAQIGGQITKILQAEGIAVEPGAVHQLAKAADGSLRDGLSLLDQAIAYTGANGENALTDAALATMLGTVDRTRVGALLGALAAGDGKALLDEVATLAELSPDWAGVLDALAEALHRVQVKQLVPENDVEAGGVDVEALASSLRAEVVQLWYQMALAGRRDLHLAPSARAGFEMCLLRMLAFRPVEGDVVSAGAPGATQRSPGPAAARAALDMGAASGSPPASQRARAPSAPPRAPGREYATPAIASPPPVATPPATAQPAAQDSPAADMPSQPAAPARHVATVDLDASCWPDFVAALDLRGPVKELAASAGFIAWSDGVLRLSLPPTDDHLKAPFLVSQLASALAVPLGMQPQLRFDAAPGVAETLHARNERQRDERQASAESAFLADPQVQRLMSQRGAKLVPDSIRPYDE
jgi:DNA polymerase-3 subunit gamma/tau